MCLLQDLKKKQTNNLAFLEVFVCMCVFGCTCIHIDYLEIFFLNSRKKLSPYVCAGALKTLMCNFNFHDNVCEYFI